MAWAEVPLLVMVTLPPAFTEEISLQRGSYPPPYHICDQYSRPAQKKEANLREWPPNLREKQAAAARGSPAARRA